MLFRRSLAALLCFISISIEGKYVIKNTTKIMMILVAISMLILPGCGESEADKKEAATKAAKERRCKEFKNFATDC